MQDKLLEFIRGHSLIKDELSLNHMKKSSIYFLAIAIVAFLPTMSMAEPKVGIGGDLSYGGREGWATGVEFSYLLNESSRIKIELKSGQSENWIGLDYIFINYMGFNIGCGANYISRKRDIYLSGNSTENELELKSVLGLEIAKTVFTPFVEHNLLSKDLSQRFAFGLRYYL